MKNATYVLILVLVLGVGLLAGKAIFKGQPLGSVIQSQEYYSTSTVWFNGGNGNTRADWVIKKSRGSLGSLIVTGAGNLAYNLYNASSTEFTDSNIASSTALLVSVPASMAVGTYVFDLDFSNGLLLDVVSGTVASTTITYR
jgi:hypothetical protein